MNILSVLGKVPVGFWVLIIQAFLWINANWIYGPFAANVKEILQIYFIVFLLVYVSLGLKLPTLNRERETLANFMFMFIITAIIMVTAFSAALPGMLAFVASVEPEAVAIAYGFVFFHGFVKAYIEEVIFRYAVPMAMKLNGKLNVYGAIISSVMFGVFHMSVAFLSGNPYPVWMMIYLSLLGLVFYAVATRFGIMGSTGAHFAYNLGVLGVLPSLIAPGVG
jgi:hypothetical protein